MRFLISPALPTLILLLLFILFGYPLWKFQRWVHYKASYQSQVQEDIKPLVIRIENLEKRIAELEKKR